MKTLRRYKKFFKNTSLSIICTLFFVVSSTPPAKADTIQAHGTVSTSYGSYTWSAQQAASTLPITVSLPYIGISFAYNSGTSFSIDYSLKNQYSGVVTITVTGNNTWSVDNVNIITSGCTLDSLPSDHASYKTSHSFTLRLKQSQNFSFVIYGAGSTVFLGSTSVSVSHNMSVDNLEQQIDSTLDLYLPGMSTSLSGLGYDSDTSTSLNADTLAYDISIIKNYIDGIEGYLSANNSYIDNIESYLSNIISKFDSIGAFRFDINQGSIGSYPHISYSTNDLTSNFYFSSELDNYQVSRLDGRFNTIATDGNYLACTFYLSSNVSYSLSNNPYTNSYIMIRDHSGAIRTINSSLYYTDYFGSYNSSSQLGVYTYTVYIPLYLFSISNDSWEYQVTLGGISSTGVNYAGFIYRGILNNLPFDIKYLSLLESIARGIGNISQQQVIENNTNINNYNNYQNQINNVENNYYNEYNTYNSDIQNNNTFDFSGLSSDGVTVYHNLFTSVFQIDLVKWPLLIILLGLIVVIILG